jgi:hypothetical protein
MTKKKPKTPAKGLNIRFQTAPPPRQTFDFAPDQKWVGARRKREDKAEISIASRVSLTTFQVN